MRLFAPLLFVPASFIINPFSLTQSLTPIPGSVCTRLRRRHMRPLQDRLLVVWRERWKPAAALRCMRTWHHYRINVDQQEPRRVQM